MFAIPFEFISRSDIRVTLNGAPYTAFTFVSDSQIQTNTYPVGTLTIQRVTTRDRRLVDFQDATVLTEADLDTAAQQSLFLSLESLDISQSSISVPTGEDGLVLPTRTDRAGTLLGFDQSGLPVAYAYGLLSGFAVTSFIHPLLSTTTGAEACASIGAATAASIPTSTVHGVSDVIGSEARATTGTPGDASTRVSTNQFVTAAINSAVNNITTAIAAPGIFVDAAWSTPPVGYRVLRCNGQAPSVTAYPGLLSIYCGDSQNATAGWGYRCTDPANPSTTRSTTGGYIVLPKSNGRFRRDLTDGATLNVGRSLWAYEADDFRSHDHGTTAGGGGQGHGGETPLTVNLDGGARTTYTGGSETRPYNYACTTWITY